MESEIFKQAKERFLRDMPCDSDCSDEGEGRCDVCVAVGELDYTFPRSGSMARIHADNKFHECSSCHGQSGKEDLGAGKGGDCHPHKIRWADECNKELARRNPRKKYTKRPMHVHPLKPILKTS